MCAGLAWEGPLYVTYGNPPPPNWPVHPQDRLPVEGALMYQCATCKWRRYDLTVKDGGAPVPQPGQKATTAEAPDAPSPHIRRE